ncbi:MAG: SDR family oxidoreductase [Bacteroidota bacterium]
MSQYDFSDLKNKAAVVTGGSSGIGLAITEALLSVGAKVAILSRNSETAVNAIASFEPQLQTNVITVSCDVVDKESVISAKNVIEKKFGQVDLLINCAGGNTKEATVSTEFLSEKFPADKEHSFFGLDVEAMRGVFDLNLFGTMLPVMVFGESMAARKKGVILNISTVASFAPLTKVPAYSASKSSINSLTQWLAVHFASANIRVNAIAPGFFLTTQNRYLLIDEKSGALSHRAENIIRNTPMGRFGKTEELRGAALFLLSDLSGFITGVVLPVDGGFLAYSGV